MTEKLNNYKRTKDNAAKLGQKTSSSDNSMASEKNDDKSKKFLTLTKRLASSTIFSPRDHYTEDSETSKTDSEDPNFVLSAM